MIRKRIIYFSMLCFLMNITLILQSEPPSLNSKSSQVIDLVEDFRPPHSLTEMLHEGLISVESTLKSSNEPIQVLKNVEQEFQQLNHSYDAMIDSSKLHTIYRDDREFLQKLLDRIDSMIANLEEDDSSGEHETVRKRSIDLMCSFRNKIKE